MSLGSSLRKQTRGQDFLFFRAGELFSLDHAHAQAQANLAPEKGPEIFCSRTDPRARASSSISPSPSLSPISPKSAA